MTKTILEVGALVKNAQEWISGPAYLVFDGQQIEEIGEGTYKKPLLGARKIVRPHSLAIPGLINTHGHAAMTLLRGAGDDMPLMDWLNQRIFPLEEQLTERAIYIGTLLACYEMLKSGTTTFTDMYMMMHHAAEAVANSGMRAMLSWGTVGFTDENRKRGIENTRSLAKAWHNAENGRLQISVGPHAPYTCPADYLRELAKLAEELQLPMQIHLSESQTEVEQALQTWGKTPIAQVRDCGLFSVPVLAAHCVHLTDEDISILAENSVCVAHNPQSNLKLASGIAPLPKMLDAGITVGLGTDGAASNNNLDMFEEMRLAATLHKGISYEATTIPAATAFAMATEYGARCLFQENKLGILEVGRAADITLLNLDSPHLTPIYDLISNLVYACGADDVTDVFVAGEHVLADGKPTRFDIEFVLHEARQIASNLSRK